MEITQYTRSFSLLDSNFLHLSSYSRRHAYSYPNNFSIIYLLYATLPREREHQFKFHFSSIILHETSVCVCTCRIKPSCCTHLHALDYIEFRTTTLKQRPSHCLALFIIYLSQKNFAKYCEILPK
jgi:hypothetical protein